MPNRHGSALPKPLAVPGMMRLTGLQDWIARVGGGQINDGGTAARENGL